MSKHINLFGDTYEVQTDRYPSGGLRITLIGQEIGEPSIITHETKSVSDNQVAIKDPANDSITDKLINTGLFECANNIIIEGWQGYRVLSKIA